VTTLLAIAALCVPFFLATLWAVTHAAQKDYGSIGKKALWTFIAAIPFVGFLIYLAFGFRRGKRPSPPA